MIARYTKVWKFASQSVCVYMRSIYADANQWAMAATMDMDTHTHEKKTPKKRERERRAIDRAWKKRVEEIDTYTGWHLLFAKLRKLGAAETTAFWLVFCLWTFFPYTFFCIFVKLILSFAKEIAYTECHFNNECLNFIGHIFSRIFTIRNLKLDTSNCYCGVIIHTY